MASLQPLCDLRLLRPNRGSCELLVGAARSCVSKAEAEQGEAHLRVSRKASGSVSLTAYLGALVLAGIRAWTSSVRVSGCEARPGGLLEVLHGPL